MIIINLIYYDLIGKWEPPVAIMFIAQIMTRVEEGKILEYGDIVWNIIENTSL